MLYRLRAEAAADFFEGRFAGLPFQRGGADLDQFVRSERTVDFGDHRPGQALLAQVNDRLEAVRFRLQRFALPGSDQLNPPWLLPSFSYLMSRMKRTSRTSPSAENCTERMYSRRTALYMR